MFAAPRRSRAVLATAVLIVMAFPSLSGAAAEPFARLDVGLQPLEAISRTGVIYDRVLPIARLERFDGSPAAPAADLGTWRQAFDELRRASFRGAAVPGLAMLDARAREDVSEGVVPLALFDRTYERVRPGALADGSLTIEGGRIIRAGAGALVKGRAFAATALAPRTYRGARVVFVLDPRNVFSDDADTPRGIVIDFADGRGFRSVGLGERVPVRYAASGEREIRFRLTRADGSIAQARFPFDVAALATPSPNDTLHITATTPYQGQYGTGDAYVYLAAIHTVEPRPLERRRGQPRGRLAAAERQRHVAAGLIDHAPCAGRGGRLPAVARHE